MTLVSPLWSEKCLAQLERVVTSISCLLACPNNDVLKARPLRGDTGNDKNHVIITLLSLPLI